MMSKKIDIEPTLKKCHPINKGRPIQSFSDFKVAFKSLNESERIKVAELACINYQYLYKQLIFCGRASRRHPRIEMMVKIYKAMKSVLDSSGKGINISYQQIVDHFYVCDVDFSN